jgi:hypothetical protein
MPAAIRLSRQGQHFIPTIFSPSPGAHPGSAITSLFILSAGQKLKSAGRNMVERLSVY